VIPDHLQYAFILAACLAVTAPLEFLGTGVYRQTRRMVRVASEPAS
jgi:hypothetical protein